LRKVGSRGLSKGFGGLELHKIHAYSWYIMKKNDEPKVWVTVLKLILLLTVLVGGVGLALWWAGKQQASVEQPPVSSPSQSWGIAGDSPIRSKR